MQISQNPGKRASAHFRQLPLARLSQAGRDCPPYPPLHLGNRKIMPGNSIDRKKFSASHEGHKTHKGPKGCGRAVGGSAEGNPQERRAPASFRVRRGNADGFAPRRGLGRTGAAVRPPLPIRRCGSAAPRRAAPPAGAGRTAGRWSGRGARRSARPGPGGKGRNRTPSATRRCRRGLY